MNFSALDIIHFWSDSRGKQIQKVFPTNGKICVYCTIDLSSEAAKVCNFINLIVKQSWIFQIKNENKQFLITFLPETVTLENLFVETPCTTSLQQKRKVKTKNPHKERVNAGLDSNFLNA